MTYSLLFQPADYWVTVHNLKSMSDGGILDVDDRLTDVADDREQVRDILSLDSRRATPKYV